LIFKTTHRFSIVFRSGLYPGQSRTWILLLFKRRLQTSISGMWRLLWKQCIDERYGESPTRQLGI